MGYRRQLTFMLLTVAVSALAADELHFYATPVRVYAGDAVTFHYLGEKGIAREAIASWKWDFDGDGKIDARGSGYSGIDATWYATYDATAGHDANDVAYLDDNGFYHVSPTLTVTTTNGLTFVQEGLTEDHYGIDPGTKAEIIVRPYNARNSEISVDFYGGPRLAALDIPTGTAAIRFYPDVELKQTGRIVGYRWSFGDGEVEDVAKQNVGYASHLYHAIGTYTVSLEVRYVLDVDKSSTNSLVEAKEAYIDIQPDKGELSLGRAYRKGFPDEYTWADIVKAYSARGQDDSGQEDRYVYYHHLQNAYDAARGAMTGDPANADNRRNMAESVNEILQELQSKKMPVSLSVGIALSDREKPGGDLFGDADKALRQAMVLGRGSWVVF